MYKHLLLIGFLLLSLLSFPQDDVPPSDADRQADSILNEFFQNRDNNSLTEQGIDSAKLEEAEERYMDNFLRWERDEKKEKLYKRILQVVIGLLFLIVLFIVLRRKRVIRRDNRPPGM
jgi:hypothetical protein